MDYKSLIYKVLEGNASPSDRELLEKWVTLDDSNLEEFQNIKTLWDNRVEPNKLNEFLPTLAKIKHQIRIRSAGKRMISPATGLLTLAAGITLSLFLIWSVNKKPVTISYVKFDNTSLHQIIQTLNEKWNVNIEVEKKEVMEYEFTGTFYNLPMDDVIRTIANRVGLSLVMGRNKKYILKGST